MELLAEFLKTHKSIVSVNLSSNKLSDTGALSLRAAMKENKNLDTVEMDGNDVSEGMMDSIRDENLCGTPPPPVKIAPIVDVAQRSGRSLAPEVGGIICTLFGASILVQPNDMLGAADITAGLMMKGPKSISGRSTEMVAVPITVGRVTEKGITQLPPTPNATKLTGNTTEVLPVELHFFKGAVLRLYHGLVGSKNRTSGFKLLFFGGYQQPRWNGGVGLAPEDEAPRPRNRRSKAAAAALKAAQEAQAKADAQAAASDPAWEVVDPKSYRYVSSVVSARFLEASLTCRRLQHQEELRRDHDPTVRVLLTGVGFLCGPGVGTSALPSLLRYPRVGAGRGGHPGCCVDAA